MKICFDVSTQMVGYIGSVYGVLAFIVKVCPTIPSKYPILIKIIKFLGNLTHNQTPDAQIRAQWDKQEQLKNNSQSAQSIK